MRSIAMVSPLRTVCGGGYFGSGAGFNGRSPATACRPSLMLAMSAGVNTTLRVPAVVPGEYGHRVSEVESSDAVIKAMLHRAPPSAEDAAAQAFRLRVAFGGFHHGFVLQRDAGIQDAGAMAQLSRTL